MILSCDDNVRKLVIFKRMKEIALDCVVIMTKLERIKKDVDHPNYISVSQFDENATRKKNIGPSQESNLGRSLPKRTFYH
jgi:hypothetical protein